MANYSYICTQLVRLNKTKRMYILIDHNENRAYSCSVLAALCPIVGVTTKTLRTWLYKPYLALKRGFILMPGEYIKSNQGGARQQKKAAS